MATKLRMVNSSAPVSFATADHELSVIAGQNETAPRPKSEVH